MRLAPHAILWLAAFGAGLLAAQAPAWSGDHSIEQLEFQRSLEDNAAAAEGSALLMTGVIGRGSYERFHAAVARVTPAIVVLDGPGGNLGEALLIGEEVRRLGLGTVVGANRSCASACAIVFLSGRTRYVGKGAAIGLHPAAFPDGSVDPRATQAMALYLGRVGVPSSTLEALATTTPGEIRWLSPSELAALGIRTLEE
jgi:hypothetical protein